MAIETPKTPASRGLPNPLLILAVGAAGAAISWLGWSSYDSYRLAHTIRHRYFRLGELRGEIVHLNEVDTMSARMAAATRDPRWEERYRRFAPQLDAAITEAIELAPTSREAKAVMRTGNADVKIDEIENRAFQLIHGGRAGEAQALLSSAEYEAEEQTYAAGIATMLAGLKEHLDLELRRQGKRAALSVGSCVAVFAALMVSALALTRSRERSRTAEARGELAAIIQSTDDAITATTFDGTIRSWNPGAERLSGYSSEEAIGRSIFHMVAPDHADAFQASFGKVRRTGTSETLETVGSKKNGTTVELSVTLSPVHDPAGRPTGVAGIARDIGAKKAVERTGSDLVAMLSHDIKTPLSVVVGLVKVLRDKPPDDPEERRELLDRIEANTRSATLLAINLVEVGRIESGSLELDLEQASLANIVERSVRSLESLARIREISIERAFDSDLPDLLLDERLFDRVVTNLLTNAIKHSPPKSSIRVQSGRRNGRVVLSVRDHGPGISPEDRPKLFQRFAALSHSRTEGTGLGLFIVKKIVEAHGGQVGFDFPAEGGSVFEVSLEPVEGSASS